MTLISQALAKIAEMEKRADEATIGPWKRTSLDFIEDNDGAMVVDGVDMAVEDIEFIAASRTDLPALYALAKALLSEGVGLNGWNGYPATEAALKAFVEGK